ncbi:PREDICTED: glutathione S-transferase A4-like [Branchiostoma belcheri]|uniref:glutathione transferase n=1 Tax=Branchiostoma belcheri TaxID=7741 RepID=A0A6P4Y4H6_BRABE|nr:PREDICTED: glutathione S-transferase A4-like [Branchiostoma belcheri]
MSDKARLTYFNGRGRGESIRFMLGAAGIEFDEAFLETKEQMEELRARGDLLFNQVPLLEIDGMKLVQTGAMIRYIARKGSLYGADDKESARIDMLTDGVRDFALKFLRVPFLADPTEHLSGIRNTDLPRYLPVYSKVLEDSGTGFLVGGALSMADVLLFEALLSVDELFPGHLKDYPKLQEFRDRVSALPNMAKFLSGGQRKPPPDAVYRDSVDTVLGRK